MRTAREFQSIRSRGIDRESFPFRLWQKAKKFGIWDPQAIDFTRDRDDWRDLDGEKREAILQRHALFQAGEEAVTRDLLPLVSIVAREGRLEEEMYLTSFLWEEAKHVELFHRFTDEVVGDPGDLARYFTPAYETIFCVELPEALGRLETDRSPEAQARASVTYNMVIEGVLAETGYYSFHETLDANGLLPGMQEAVAHIQRDESRHLAYGVFLLSRLVAEHGEPVWRTIERRMEELQPLVLALIDETWIPYETKPHPFGLAREDFVEYALGQFQKRWSRIERARSQPLAEVLRMSLDD